MTRLDIKRNIYRFGSSCRGSEMHSAIITSLGKIKTIPRDLRLESAHFSLQSVSPRICQRLLGGPIYCVLLEVDDGAEENNLFVDADPMPAMLMADLITATDSSWTAAGALDVRIRNNRSFVVGQDSSDTDVDR